MSHESQIRFIEGSRLAVTNANALFKMGGSAASEGEYGVACSLNVLAAEEAVKAIFLFFRYYYYNPDKKGDNDNIETITKSIFSNHKQKHTYLRRVILGISVQGKSLSEMYGFLLTIIESAKSRLPQIAEITEQVLPKLREHEGLIEQYVHLRFDIDGLFSWLDCANDEKNSGLYVGLDKEAWLDPRSPGRFNSDRYRKESAYSSSVIDFASNVEKFTSVYEQFDIKSLALLIYSYFSESQPVGGNKMETTPLLKEYFDLIMRIEQLRNDADRLLSGRGENITYRPTN